MSFIPITQCGTELNFKPRLKWPAALPALAWRGQLLTGFDRREGVALDLERHSGCSWLEAILACYPELGVAELSRLMRCLNATQSALAREIRVALFAEFGLRWCERLEQTLNILARTPFAFQTLVDDKKLGPRDLAPLLALPNEGAEFMPFLLSLVPLDFSKSQLTQVLERGVELYLLDHPLNDLMPADTDPDEYLRRLEKWRRPRTTASDETWRKVVAEWPWPSQVQGQWQRFGDQAGLEIKIRSTSPQDLSKKLERLLTIPDSWSCQP